MKILYTILAILFLINLQASAADDNRNLDQMSMVEQLQDLDATALESVQGLDRLYRTKDLGARDYGARCFLVGNAFANMRVLRVLHAGNEKKQDEIDTYINRAMELKSLYCK